MDNEYEQQKRKQVATMRSIMDYGMGVIWLAFGAFFIFHEQIKLNILNFPPSAYDKFIGGLFILYGAWRIYRGYKKNYFR
jgi:hypothetical protein